MVIAAPFLIVLTWAIVSYSAWMLQPTSMRWNERSAEWVRNEVPFGNAMVDQGEHVYYSVNAPKTGGPQLKTLPTVGQGATADQPPEVTGRCLAAAGQAGLPAPAARRRNLEADRPVNRRRPTSAGDDLPP